MCGQRWNWALTAGRIVLLPNCSSQQLVPWTLSSQFCSAQLLKEQVVHLLCTGEVPTSIVLRVVVGLSCFGTSNKPQERTKQPAQDYWNPTCQPWWSRADKEVEEVKEADLIKDRTEVRKMGHSGPSWCIPISPQREGGEGGGQRERERDLGFIISQTETRRA